MPDADLYSLWYLALGLTAVVVVIAAGLLIGVWLSARRILKLAGAALGLVQQIRENTNGVWALEATNQTAAGILDEAEAIRDHAGLVAHALHEAEAR